MRFIRLCKASVFIAGYLLLVTLPITALHKSACVSPDRPAPSNKITAQMPDLQQLAMLANSGSALPLDEQLREDREIAAEQIAAAKEWLDSAQVEERVAGAEQLSAYPTAVAEGYLQDALTRDIDASVRTAAAQSLSYIQSPKPKTITALIKAMQDGDEDVRINSFNTLQTYANRPQTEPEMLKLIFQQLKKLIKTGVIDSDDKESVQAFLADQTN